MGKQRTTCNCLARGPLQLSGTGTAGKEGTAPTGGPHQVGAESYLLLNEEPLEVENLQSFQSSILLEYGIKPALEQRAVML